MLMGPRILRVFRRGAQHVQIDDIPGIENGYIETSHVQSYVPSSIERVSKFRGNKERWRNVRSACCGNNRYETARKRRNKRRRDKWARDTRPGITRIRIMQLYLARSKSRDSNVVVPGSLRLRVDEKKIPGELERFRLVAAAAASSSSSPKKYTSEYTRQAHSVRNMIESMLHIRAAGKQTVFIILA